MNRYKNDSPHAMPDIQSSCNQKPGLELIATTVNLLKGLEIIKEQCIDLVFFDIQMPELTGFEFIRMAVRPRMTILTTAYAEFSLESYEHNALDYLLKPFPFERFYRATEKAFTQKQVAASLQSEPIVRVLNPVQTFIFRKKSKKIEKLIWIIFYSLNAYRTT